jgi:ABC-type glycerol-3-phosphate transport system substrate-binding protein
MSFEIYPGVFVSGFYKNNSQIDAARFAQFNGTSVWYSEDKEVDYYLIGAAAGATPTKRIEAWVPYDYNFLLHAYFVKNIAGFIRDQKRTTEQVKFRWSNWGEVVNAPLCFRNQTVTEPCPEILFLGTTQIAKRWYENLLKPLNEYFADWLEQRGDVLSDDILRSYYYDMNYNGDWAAIPMNTDTRVLFFNKTVYDQLSLKYPPPYSEWTPDNPWDFSAMARHAKIIYNAFKTPGFPVPPLWLFFYRWRFPWDAKNKITPSPLFFFFFFFFLSNDFRDEENKVSPKKSQFLITHAGGPASMLVALSHSLRSG